MGLVQSASNDANSGSSLTVTLSSSTTAGNCLVVCVGTDAGAGNPTVTGITLGGSAGNFAQAKGLVNSTFGGNCEIWTDPNCAGGQTSVVISFTSPGGAGPFLTAWVMEWSGIVSASPVDKTNGQAPSSGSGASWSSLASGTLAQPNEVAIGAVLAANSSITITGPASPWSNLAQVNDPSSTVSLLAGYQVVSSTAGVTYSGTFSPNSVYTSVIVTLKVAPTVAPQAQQQGGRTFRRRFRRHQALSNPVLLDPSTASYALGALAFSGQANVAYPYGGKPQPGGKQWRRVHRRHQQAGIRPKPGGTYGLAGLGFSGTANVTPASIGSFALAGLGFSGTDQETEATSGSYGLAGLGFSGQVSIPQKGLPQPGGRTFRRRFRRHQAQPSQARPVSSGGEALGALAFSGTAAVTFPFPEFPLGLKYEILLNGVWTDITDYVYQRDASITTRGRPDESTTAPTPSQMTLTLNNRDGRFSPKNTAGAYYPYLARNVQLRCSITNQTSSSTGVTYTGYRFWGEVSSWPPQWDPSESDIYCQITASGILRRYQQSKSLGSPMYQYWTTRASGSDPLIYYPMEDAGFLSTANTQAFTAGYIAPRVTNSSDPLIQAMAVSGTPEFASDVSFGGSAPLPLIEGATCTSGDVDLASAPTQLNYVFLMNAPNTATDDVAIITIQPNVSPASGLDQVVLLYRNAAAVVSLEVIGYSAGPTTIFDSGSISTPSVGGIPSVLCVTITATAVTVSVTYPGLVFGTLLPVPVETVYTHAATTNFTATTGGFTISAPGGVAIGHVAVCDFAPDLLGIASAASGYNGEPALVRFDRLCAERGITTPARTDYGTTLNGYSPSDWWKLNELFGASTILNTATGHADTITAAFTGLVASPVIVAPSGQAVTAAVASELTALTNASPSGLSAVTVMAWVNLAILPGSAPGSTDAHIVANSHTSSDHKGFSLLLSGGATPEIQFGNGTTSGSVTSSNPVLTYGWYMLAATWDGTSITLYVNGVSQGTAPLSGTLAGGTDDVALGYNPVIGSGSSEFVGLMSQVAIIPSALTAAQISGLWMLNAGAIMGPQASDTLLNLLQAVENLDRGQVYEPRTFLGLDYKTRVQLQAQTAALTLDYSASEIAQSLQPVEDDQLSRNDVTLTQTGGSSFTASLLSGTMSVQDPPDGIGDYSYPLTVNSYTEAQLPACAGWIVTVGTVDEYRYPVVTIDLARSEVAALFALVPALDVGSYVLITNPPSFVDSAASHLLAWGFTETFGPFGIWTIAINGVPESPYQGADLPTW